MNNHRQIIHNEISIEIQEIEYINAIYIPFKDRYEYLQMLINELSWYAQPIFILPTDKEIFLANFIIKKHNIFILDIRENLYNINFFKTLKTSTHNKTKNVKDCWDLPLKRNFALKHSIISNYKKILIVDDDMFGLSPNIILKGSTLLKKFPRVGSYIDDFPDTSFIGHLELKLGMEIETFISGSFLFIDTSKITSFFPYVYNEDWLFMLPQILEKEICAFGFIKQRAFNPFVSIETAIFQEFGEIFTEGIYNLIHSDEMQLRFLENYWDSFLGEHNNKLKELGKIQNQFNQKEFNKLIYYSEQISSKDCILFAEGLENDNEVIKKFFYE